MEPGGRRHAALRHQPDGDSDHRGHHLLVTGVAPLHRLDDAQNRLGVAIAAVALVAVAVVLALAANGADLTRNSLDADQAQSTTIDWLEGSDLSLVSVDLTDDTATVVLAGTGDPPPAVTLADDLKATLGRRVTLDLQWIPRQQTIVVSD